MKLLTTPYLKILNFDEGGALVLLHNRPVGTGPYEIKTVGSKQIILKPFSSYHGKSKRTFDLVKYVVTPDNDDYYKSFSEGKFDVYFQQHFKFVEKLKNRGAVVHTFPLYMNDLLLLNLRDNVLKFDDIRRAIAFSIDRQSIAQMVFSERPYSLSSVISMGVLGNYFIEQHGFYEHDMEKGRMLVRNILNSNPHVVPKVCIEYTRASGHSPVIDEMIAICNFIKDIGVGCEIKEVNRTTWINNIMYGKYSISRVSYAPDYLDPDAFLFPFVMTDQLYNNTGYSNLKVDKDISLARRTRDKNKRAEIYTTIHRQLANDIPFIPLYNRYGVIAYNRNKIKHIPMNGQGLYYVRIREIC